MNIQFSPLILHTILRPVSNPLRRTTKKLLEEGSFRGSYPTEDARKYGAISDEGTQRTKAAK